MSTGVYGYPQKEAALVAVSTVLDVLRENADRDEVSFVCFSEASAEAHRDALRQCGVTPVE